MNNVLELKGKRFVQAKRGGVGGGPAINSVCTVTSKTIKKLILQLCEIEQFWRNENKPFSGVIISVYYNKIVAKSNRIAGLLKGKDSNSAIVGAKFNKEKDKHIITYFIEMDELVNSINLLTKTNELLLSLFKNGIGKDLFYKDSVFDKIKFDKYSLNKSVFKQVIADVSYIDDFAVDEVSHINKESIITIYDTGMDIKQLLKNFGIDILTGRVLDNRTVYLDENQLKNFLEKAPYLVAMATENLSELTPDDFIRKDQQQMMSIPDPTIQPTIGVIDTLFDSRVYFSKWVDYHDMINDSIPKSQEDYRHGTEVASIIVDGPRLNPWLNDDCGRFRVRHFGVAVGKNFSSFIIIKQIKSIIAGNKDIKVWNISLGSNQEINDNFISAEAAVLDQIQFENDVIFVVAGTNKPNENIKKIGSPADSINSMVVNSVTKSGKATNYLRTGLALSFFAKPDVSYYGGSEEEYIRVCEPLGEAFVAGTSFAAPWIARKLSYLIDIIGVNREVAKAMIIDSARGWKAKPTPEEVAIFGHGIVPIRIEDIVNSKDDEIKFVVTDISEKWNTYNYNFPIPLKDDKYPYVARATMCYFPICDRAQGVDYTNTELNLHFGRLDDKGKLKEINDDKQNREEAFGYRIFEGTARKQFRKWDNVKYIIEVPKGTKRAKESYENKNWGMEIKTNNRLDPKDGVGLRFGVVVTMKEINGVNRIEEFIKNCNLNGWIVNQIDIKNRIDIHEKVKEEIELI